MAEDPVPVLIAALMLPLVMFLGLAIYASRYKRVPPNHAMIVFGRRSRLADGGFKVITGGGRFIQPIVETFEMLDLEPFEVQDVLDSVVEDARAVAPRALRVQILATARITDDPDGLRIAAKNLLRTPRDQVREIVRATIEGHARALLASESPGIHDSEVSQIAREKAQDDLAKVGIHLQTLAVTRLGSSEGAASLAADVAALRRTLEQVEARLARLEETARTTERGRTSRRR